MQFNSLNIKSLSEFKLIRILRSQHNCYKYAALHLPTKKYVIIDEKVESPQGKKIQDEYAKLLFDLGPHENVIRYLGFSHLDGRTYLITKLYELGDLNSQLIAYKRNYIAFQEQTIWLIMGQIVTVAVDLLNKGIYPHLNPSTIYLESKVPTYFPEIDFIDDGQIKRKLRVNICLSALEKLQNISKYAEYIDIDTSDKLNLEYTIFQDKLLSTALQQKLIEHKKDIFDPEYQPQSVSFVHQTNIQSKSSRKQNVELIKRYHEENMATYLNSQLVEKSMFRELQQQEFNLLKAEKTGEQLIIEELSQLLDIMISLNYSANCYDYSDNILSLQNMCKQHFMSLSSIYLIINEYIKRYEDSNNAVKCFQKHINNHLRTSSPTRGNSAYVNEFFKQAKKQNIQSIEIAVEPKRCRSPFRWRDSIKMRGAMAQYMYLDAQKDLQLNNRSNQEENNMTAKTIRVILQQTMDLNENDQFGQSTMKQIKNIQEETDTQRKYLLKIEYQRLQEEREAQQEGDFNRSYVRSACSPLRQAELYQTKLQEDLVQKSRQANRPASPTRPSSPTNVPPLRTNNSTLKISQLNSITRSNQSSKAANQTVIPYGSISPQKPIKIPVFQTFFSRK